MASANFTQSEVFSELDGITHGKNQQLNDRQVTLNRAVRFVWGDVDLRSSKRSAPLSPNLFTDVHNYTSPADLKDTALIDVRRQVKRASFEKFYQVDITEFDRFKDIIPYRVAIKDESFSQILKIDGVRGNKKATIHNCNSLTDNGTWALVAGTDSTNLTLDTENFITGNGALNFDASAGAATAAIELTGATQVDLTDHDERGSLFVWVFIPDYSDAEGDTVTNFILRWGNDDQNYWARTVTTTNEGITFFDGWNLLRFDWNASSATGQGTLAETGTVDPSAIDYVRLTITKSTSLAADTDWRVDDIVSRVGDIYDVVYYTRFGWQTSAAVYIEDATATTDVLNVDASELQMILFKAAEFSAQELRDYDDVTYFRGEYERAKKHYRSMYRSERMKRLTWYGRPRNPNARLRTRSWRN